MHDLRVLFYFCSTESSMQLACYKLLCCTQKCVNTLTLFKMNAK